MTRLILSTIYNFTEQYFIQNWITVDGGTVDRYASAGECFGDLNLSTRDLENLNSLWPNHRNVWKNTLIIIHNSVAHPPVNFTEEGGQKV